MGYIAHRCMVLTSWNEEHITAAHAMATDLMPDVTSPVVASPINGYYSFLVAPDGSKEGWEDSDTYDALRAQLADQIEEAGIYIDWFIARYGGDDDDLAFIERHSGEPGR